MSVLGVNYSKDTKILTVTLSGPGTMELIVTGRPANPGEVITEVGALVDSLYPALLVALRQCTDDPETLSGLSLLEQLHRIRTGNRVVIGDTVNVAEVYSDAELRRLLDPGTEP